MLLDSNVLIYAADPDDDCCAGFAEHADALICSVVRIEVLGFPGIGNLSREQRERLHEIVESMVMLDLGEPVIQRAIALRQQKKMGLADAIIAATALVHNLPLVTRNVADFRHIAELDLRNPFDLSDAVTPPSQKNPGD